MNKEQQQDDLLWEMAKARAGFKRSLFTYLVVNAFLIGIWFFSAGPDSYFWPIWAMLGWGVGVAFQYFHAYHNNKFITADKEYDRLKQKQSN